jgi:neutral ceramidase
MAVLRAGFASSEITPSIGTPLGGYLGRPQFAALGIHDPLFAKALALDHEGGTVLLFTLDLLGLTQERAASIAEAVGRACGLPSGQVVIACTHTHSGPSTLPLRGMPYVSEGYFDYLTAQMVRAGRAALAGLRPARLLVGQGRSDVGINRRVERGGVVGLGENPAGTYDDALLALRFLDAETERTLGVVTAYGCHLTSLGERNMLISAEWAGLAMAALERQLGCPCLYFNGPFGNVNPRGRNGTWARTEEIADTFRQDCLAALAQAGPEPELPVGLVPVEVELPLAPLAPEEEIRATLEKAEAVLSGPADEDARRVAAVQQSYARAVQARRAAGEERKSLAVRLTGLRIGSVALVGMPGEVFAEYALWLREESPLRYTVVLGNVGSEDGYLPTAAAFSEGGYEPGSFVYFWEQGYSEGIEGVLMDGAREMLRQLAALT